MDKKYVLIVGASSGIGENIAVELSNDENIIILMARRRDKLLEVQHKLKGESLIYECDVCDYDQIGAFFDYIKEQKIKLSAMIYTTGVCYIKPIKAMEANELESMFKTNVFGFFEMCRYFQSPKISERGSSIIVISSYASITKEAGMSAYSMTKASINTAVSVMAKEFSKREIRVNAILPAHVMSKMASDNNEWSAAELEDIKAKQALGVIPIGEIVSLIKLLLSEQSSHMTGEMFTISAGYLTNS